MTRSLTHLATTSDYILSGDPAGRQNPQQFTSFRTTTRTTRHHHRQLRTADQGCALRGAGGYPASGVKVTA
jgi:hypothetical protein